MPEETKLRLISEKKDGRKTYYVVSTVNEHGEVLAQREVKYPLYQLDYNGYQHFLLYDDAMTPVRDVYNYLNFEMQEKSYNTRSNSAHALRLLYCFLDITNRSISKLDQKAFGEFKYFIRGININPKGYELITRRSNATVNVYFAIYRTFFKYIGIECPVLFDSRDVIVNSTLDSGSKIKLKKYESNLKTNSRTERYVPKYISPDEFSKIYRHMMKAQDKQAQIIVHLMYGYGLRLGEVLGLTLEDVDEVLINDEYESVLWLRNRMSDKKFQCAKGLMHPMDKSDYTSPEYIKTSVKIRLNEYFNVELLTYLAAEFNEVSEHRQARMESAKADIVTDTFGQDENYYIFLNRYGKALSEQVWNNKLRQYFKECGLTVDLHHRENNLSHRFRHGFAMFHAKYSPNPVDVLRLQKLMRHHSMASTMIYYNPTPEDEREMKAKFQKDMYQRIPELGKGINYDE